MSFIYMVTNGYDYEPSIITFVSADWEKAYDVYQQQKEKQTWADSVCISRIPCDISYGDSDIEVVLFSYRVKSKKETKCKLSV